MDMSSLDWKGDPSSLDVNKHWWPINSITIRNHRPCSVRTDAETLDWSLKICLLVRLITLYSAVWGELWQSSQTLHPIFNRADKAIERESSFGKLSIFLVYSFAATATNETYLKFRKPYSWMSRVNSRWHPYHVDQICLCTPVVSSSGWLRQVWHRIKDRNELLKGQDGWFYFSQKQQMTLGLLSQKCVAV